ncbi:MAG: hypothetical protein ACRC4P_02185 [Aeromonas sp.]
MAFFTTRAGVIGYPCRKTSGTRFKSLQALDFNEKVKVLARVTKERMFMKVGDLVTLVPGKVLTIVRIYEVMQGQTSEGIPIIEEWAELRDRQDKPSHWKTSMLKPV